MRKVVIVSRSPSLFPPRSLGSELRVIVNLGLSENYSNIK